MTVIGSVARLISFCPRKNPFFSNLSGAHAQAVYRVFRVWESPYCGVAPIWDPRYGEVGDPSPVRH